MKVVLLYYYYQDVYLKTVQSTHESVDIMPIVKKKQENMITIIIEKVAF